MGRGEGNCEGGEEIEKWSIDCGGGIYASEALVYKATMS
jgi:hypothetical protein